MRRGGGQSFQVFADLISIGEVGVDFQGFRDFIWIVEIRDGFQGFRDCIWIVKVRDGFQGFKDFIWIVKIWIDFEGIWDLMWIGYLGVDFVEIEGFWRWRVWVGLGFIWLVQVFDFVVSSWIIQVGVDFIEIEVLLWIVYVGVDLRFQGLLQIIQIQGGGSTGRGLFSMGGDGFLCLIWVGIGVFVFNIGRDWCLVWGGISVQYGYGIGVWFSQRLVFMFSLGGGLGFSLGGDWFLCLVRVGIGVQLE